jgi:hypothetical protein
MIDYLKERFDIKADGLYRKDGTRAGFLRKDGYRVINVSKPKKCQMLEHRAVWLMTHGYLPTELDHIDRNKSNNALSNLHEVTRAENNRNKVSNKGIKKSCKKWTAEMRCQGKYYYLGRFDTQEEAMLARKKAENTLW